MGTVGALAAGALAGGGVGLIGGKALSHIMPHHHDHDPGSGPFLDSPGEYGNDNIWSGDIAGSYGQDGDCCNDINCGSGD